MSNDNNWGRPPKFKTVEELEVKIKEHFESLIRLDDDSIPYNSKPLTITGLALALGFCSRQSFYAYEKKPDFSYTMKRARTVVEESYEEGLQGKACTGAIFALKNMGWTDRQEIDMKTQEVDKAFTEKDINDYNNQQMRNVLKDNESK